MVLYHPDPGRVRDTAANLGEQADLLCVVDNTPGADNAPLFAHIPNCTYISHGGNLGIAAGHNTGIRHLLASGCEYVLLSDQDSMAPEGMLDKLLRAHRHLEQAGERIGAVGPLPIQRNTGLPIADPVNKQWEGMVEGMHVMHFDTIISSWSLIKRDALEEVGLMDESLFIDGVDYDWCCRAKYLHRRRSFIIDSLRLSHMLGEETSGRIRIPTPFRVYYQFRNYLRLVRRPYMPGWWKRKNGLKYTVKAVYYPLFLKPRGAFARQIARGIRDGLRSR